MQTVAAAKGQKQAPVPAVKVCEIHFDRLFNLLLGGQRFSDPFECGCRCIAFSLAGCALEECRDFPQLVAEFPFSRHPIFPFI
jgi:hypothetical protein